MIVATDVAFEAPRQVHSLSMKRHAKERVKRSGGTRVRHQDPRCPPSWTYFEHSAPPVLLNDCTQQESSTLPHHSIPERTRIDSRQRRHPAGVNGSTPFGPGLSPRDVERASTGFFRIQSPIHLSGWILDHRVYKLKPETRDPVLSPRSSRAFPSPGTLSQVILRGDPDDSSMRHGLRRNLFSRRTHWNVSSNGSLPWTQWKQASPTKHRDSGGSQLQGTYAWTLSVERFRTDPGYLDPSQ